MSIKQPTDAFGYPLYPGLKVAYATDRGVRHGTIKSMHVDGSLRIAKRATGWRSPVVRVTRTDRVFVDQESGLL